jgi:hypothetical protein
MSSPFARTVGTSAHGAAATARQPPAPSIGLGVP